MKVLHLLTMNTFSGAENVACQIIKIMEKLYGVESVYGGVEGEIRQAVTDKGITFVGMNQFSLAEVKRVIKEVKPDLIHAHDMRASTFASIACGRIPLVCHIHNNAFDSRKVNMKSLLFYFATKKAKNVIWVSRSAYEGYVFKDKLAGKSVVLPNILDIDELYEKVALDNQAYDYDAIFLGRLAKEKNPMRLIDIFSSVIKELPEAKLAIVGKGALEDNVKNKVKELHIEKNVDFLGFQKNPYKILQSSKLMIMTSLWEGLPMCALEAMALSVPIISTPTDGLKNLVIDGETGYLSEDNEVLKERIVEVISNESLRNHLKEKSLQEAKRINDVHTYGNVLMFIYSH